MNVIKMERITGDFGFQVKDENGHILQTDSSIDNGGSNYGFRPMQLILSALGSCSAIDMASILKKQRQTIEKFKIVIEGEREQDIIPSFGNLLMYYLNYMEILTGKKQQSGCIVNRKILLSR